MDALGIDWYDLEVTSDKVKDCPLPAEVSLEKSVDNPSPAVGEEVVFTLDLKNSGPSPATKMQVEDRLPSGYTYVGDDSDGAYDPDTGVWDQTLVPPKRTRSLQITARVNASGEYKNTAEITQAHWEDNNSSDNRDSASVTPLVPASADLSLRKTADKATVPVGQQVVFTIVMDNAGPDGATGVQVKDELPSGYTYVGDDAGGGYSSLTGMWRVGAVPAGGSVTLRLTARVNEAGEHKNVVQVIALTSQIHN